MAPNQTDPVAWPGQPGNQSRYIVIIIFYIYILLSYIYICLFLICIYILYICLFLILLYIIWFWKALDYYGLHRCCTEGKKITIPNYGNVQSIPQAAWNYWRGSSLLAPAAKVVAGESARSSGAGHPSCCLINPESFLKGQTQQSSNITIQDEAWVTWSHTKPWLNFVEPPWRWHRAIAERTH